MSTIFLMSSISLTTVNRTPVMVKVFLFTRQMIDSEALDRLSAGDGGVETGVKSR